MYLNKNIQRNLSRRACKYSDRQTAGDRNGKSHICQLKGNYTAVKNIQNL